MLKMASEPPDHFSRMIVYVPRAMRILSRVNVAGDMRMWYITKMKSHLSGFLQIIHGPEMYEQHVLQKYWKTIFVTNVLSRGYVAVDIIHSVYDADKEKRGMTLLNKTFFHYWASFVLPGRILTFINRRLFQVVREKDIHALLARYLSITNIGRIPAVIGLCCIPFIFDPVDNVAEWVSNSLFKLI